MKVSSSPSRLFFAAAGAFSVVCALHTGLVLAITAPRVPASNHAVRRERQASLGMIGVDEEGNLLWCTNESAPSASEADSSSTAKPWSALLSLRGGGDLCVDREGNFYTPRRIAAPADSSTNTKVTAASGGGPVSPTTEALRGGSHHHQNQVVAAGGGGLRVDSEGNLFFSSAPTHGAAAAAALRGGELSVDNEGNFFSPRRQQQAPVPPVCEDEAPVLARRRSRNSHDDPPGAIVVLAKNQPVSSKNHRHPKKIHTNNKQPKKNDSRENDETPMAFIGYNNALMET